MSTANDKNRPEFKVEIGTNQPRKWSDQEITELKAQAKENAKKRSPERRLKNELMAIQLEMEEYINENVEHRKSYSIDTFLHTYLKLLNLTLKKFALSIDTTDANLKKYLSGERKFNADLAMRFGAFFHTSPDIWLKVQLKNELLELKREKRQNSHYKKYDYAKVIRLNSGHRRAAKKAVL